MASKCCLPIPHQPRPLSQAAPRSPSDAASWMNDPQVLRTKRVSSWTYHLLQQPHFLLQTFTNRCLLLPLFPISGNALPCGSTATSQKSPLSLPLLHPLCPSPTPVDSAFFTFLSYALYVSTLWPPRFRTPTCDFLVYFLFCPVNPVITF